MFCPNCGNPDQEENTYCRQCGEFLVGTKSLGAFSFGGVTPRQNVNAISLLSLIAALLSLLAALWMYITKFNLPIALYLGAAILLCNAFWHLANIYTARKLASRILQNPRGDEKGQTAMPRAETRELLEPADMSSVIPATVTENTTRQLVTPKKHEKE
jgi:hypothetical protein